MTDRNPEHRVRRALVATAVLAAASCATPRPDDGARDSYHWYREFGELPLGVVKSTLGIAVLPFVVAFSPPPYKSGMNIAVNWIDSSLRLLNPLENDYETWNIEEQRVTDEQAQRLKALNYLNTNVNLLE